jgi:trehalose 6-phosphate synthase/phosphatase
MKSLSESHEQIVVAWTGDVLLQTTNEPTPKTEQASTFRDTLHDLIPAQSRAGNGDVSPAAPALAPMSQEKPLKVYGNEFTKEEQAELKDELERFSELEEKNESGGKLRYIPVFLPSEVSKGHYEGFCKKSE